MALSHRLRHQVENTFYTHAFKKLITATGNAQQCKKCRTIFRHAIFSVIRGPPAPVFVFD